MPAETFDTARKLDRIARLTDGEKARARQLVADRMAANGWAANDIAETFDMLGITLEPQ